MTVVDERASPDRRSLDVSGNRVTLCRGGNGEKVLYLHGLCDLHSVTEGDHWTEFLDHMADRFDVVAPALPGYNGSTGAESFEDVEDYVWHLVDFMEAAGIARAHVVGHSFGGWLAAELALRHPSHVERLVLVSPLGLHVSGVEVPSFFGAVAPRGIGGLGEARRLLFGDPDSKQAVSALPDAMEPGRQLLWFSGLAGAARIGWKAPHFQSRKLTRNLGRIDVPTLVLRGGSDVLVPADAAKVWEDSVPDALLVEMEGAGHCLPLEVPRAADHVCGFLAPTASS